MRFRDKNGPTLYPILQTAAFAGFFRRRAQKYFDQLPKTLDLATSVRRNAAESRSFAIQFEAVQILLPIR